MSDPSDLAAMAKELGRRVQAMNREIGPYTTDAATTAEAAGIPCDLVETADAFVLAMDIPGAEPSSLRVTVTGRRVHVSAEHKAAPAGEGRRAVMVERAGGRMTRTIELPADAEGDSAETRYVSGVLTVKLAKVAPAAGPRGS